MFTRDFWLKTLERALKTFAQTAAALLGANAINFLDADWRQILGVAVTAAIVSVLTSVASSEIGPKGTPELVGNTTVADVPPIQVAYDNTGLTSSSVVTPEGAPPRKDSTAYRLPENPNDILPDNVIPGDN